MKQENKDKFILRMFFLLLVSWKLAKGIFVSVQPIFPISDINSVAHLNKNIDH